MRFVDILKRDGQALTTEEINFMIRGYVAGEIPDDVSPLHGDFSGMTRQETIDLTMSMVHSGDTLDLSGIPGIKGTSTQQGVGIRLLWC